MKISIFNLLLIFSCVYLVSNFLAIDNLPTPDNGGPPPPPENNEDGAEEEACKTWRGSNGDHCWRVGLDPNSTFPFTIEVERYGVQTDQNIIVAGGCFGGYQEHNYADITSIKIESNPLKDRTINWIDIIHNSEDQAKITVYKRSVNGAQQQYCNFVPSTHFFDGNRKFFYVYGDDEKAATMKLSM